MKSTKCFSPLLTAGVNTFKAEAIAKVKENDDNVSLTAKELGIPMQTLAEWQKSLFRI